MKEEGEHAIFFRNANRRISISRYNEIAITSVNDRIAISPGSEPSFFLSIRIPNA